MISTPQQLSVLIDELASSTWTMAALGVLFDSGLADQLVEPRSLDELAVRCPSLSRERIARVLAVAVARGVATTEGGRHQLAPGVMASMGPGERTVLRGDLWSNLLQPAVYLRAGSDPARAGWQHTDPAILQAQGDGSSMFAAGLRGRLAPQMGDLAQRLARPGARFLDVGVGVAALSIAMCREFPELTVVGLDPAEAPQALARANVAAAGLGGRIELRTSTIGELREEASFDLAWLPTFFLGERERVAGALARIHGSLRPGGWVLSPAINPAAGEAQRAVWSLVLESWGGPVLEAAELQQMVGAAGLDARTLPGPSWISMVVGCRRS